MHAETLEEDSASLRRPVIPEGKEIAKIRLFFGVFDKSEMADAILRFCAPANELGAFEDMERGDLEGDTCFASLELDANGVPLFDRFAISTLPWALGRIAKDGLTALSLSAFAESMKKLKELLENFRAQRHLGRSAEADGAEPLTPAEILALNRLLQDWAGFSPKPGRPVALAEIRFREKRETSVKQLEPPQIIDMVPAGGDEDEEDDAPEVEQEIGQGKEEDIVFMVLGTDAEHRDAAIWAASRPNLLNVAATRGRYRLFIVGDRDLWSGLPYCSDAADMLPVVREGDFLGRFMV